MSRFKILFITSWYPTEENPIFGIFIKEHAKAASFYNDIVVMHLQGYDARVKGLYEYKETIYEGIRTVRVRYRRFPIPKMPYLNYILTAILGFRRLIKQGFNPDIIHANIYSAGVPAVDIGKLFKIPVVITEHSSCFPRKILSKKEIKRARFAMLRAKYILPVSNFLRKCIESYEIKNRFKVIPNVVDTNLFYPNNQAPKDTYTKRILLVASLNSIKGVSYLLQALHTLNKRRNDFSLDIIGNGPNRKEYENLAIELGIRNKIYFHGIKSKQEIAEFMRENHFFVLPSLCETFGTVLIEALASGLPVIATNIGGPSEIINKKVGILIPPKNIQALTTAINYMLDHYKDYSPEEIAKYAKEKFSYKAVGKKMNQIYREILKNYKKKYYL